VITTSPGASAAPSGEVTIPGVTTYRVTAENGDYQDYDVTVFQTGAGNIGFTITDEGGGLIDGTALAPLSK
jgi:hypothetical protein